MKLLKNNLFNSFFIFILTLFYGLIFIITNNHVELTRMVPSIYEVKRKFSFNYLFVKLINENNMIKLGFALILISLILLIISFILYMKNKFTTYDEYQFSIISKSLIFIAVISLSYFPIIFISLLSTPEFIVSNLFFIATIQVVILNLGLGFNLLKFNK